MQAGCPSEKSYGEETVRLLGDLWILAEGRGQMPGGGEASTLLTLGYNPAVQHYLGTWVGSMMSHLWVYKGMLDAGGAVLTLDTEGPSMSGDGSMARYRDVVRVLAADHRVLESEVLTAGGAWQKFMTAHYRKKR
jgi:hypothetical protein